jgi:hypothetical protein
MLDYLGASGLNVDYVEQTIIRSDQNMASVLNGYSEIRLSGAG